MKGDEDSLDREITRIISWDSQRILLHVPQMMIVSCGPIIKTDASVPPKRKTLKSRAENLYNAPSFALLLDHCILICNIITTIRLVYSFILLNKILKKYH